MIDPEGALMALGNKEMVMVHGGEGPKHIMLSYQVRTVHFSFELVTAA